MKKNLSILFILALGLFLLPACGLLQEPAAPSATLEAIPLDSQATPAALNPVTSSSGDATQPTVAPSADNAYPASGAEAAPDSAPAENAYPAGQPAAPQEAAPPTQAYPAPDASAPRVFTISQADSQVSFELDEDLRGVRTTVIGITNQVAGELGINLNDLSTAQVGVLQINARTLATDNNFRNRAIQNEILDTQTYELITFTPTAVTGLPPSAAVGQEVSFTITGDLTIRDITQPVTFNVTATAVSDTQLVGMATAVVSRAAYNLTIPEVPNVANVEDEVQLTINFVANAS